MKYSQGSVQLLRKNRDNEDRGDMSQAPLVLKAYKSIQKYHREIKLMNNKE